LYRREDYDLLTYLGDIGGLLDFILLFGWSTSTVFVSRLFSAAIIERVYRLQKYLQDMTSYYETRIQGQVSSSGESEISSSNSSSDPNSSEESGSQKEELDPTKKL